MVDMKDREDWKRERSLLALGQAVRGEDDTGAPPGSPGYRAHPSWREDAATRHRLARSQRETQSPGHESDFPPPPQQVESAEYAPASPAATEQRPRPEHDQDAYRSHAEFEVRHPHGVQQSSSDDGDGQRWKPLIDPMQVVRGVARSKLLIVTTTLLGAGLGIAIALSTPKKYEASTELIVDPRDLKLTDRDLTQSVVASDATLAIVENQVRVLTSGTVLNKVVDKLNLVDDPEFNGQGGGGFSPISLIRSVLSPSDGPGGADSQRRRALALNNLAESLSVERGGKTFVITVSATTQNGEKSALIANTMTDVFLQTFGQIQSETAGRATDELTARLDELRKGVEAAERKVEDFRASHDLVDAQGHLISDDEMLKLNEQLSVARARTLELNARAASARGVDVNSVLAGTLPEEISSNTMSDLRSQYATLKQEADRAAIRLGPRHPELQALNAQLAGARERIASELRRIASSLQVDLKRAVQLEQDLASRLAQLKVRSGDVNDDLVSMRELEREATAKRSVYEQYLLRAKETGEQKDINTANINVISKAFAPLEATGPSRAMIVLAGLLLGFASGIGLGVMRGAYESLRETATSRSRRDRSEDERRTRYEDRAYQAAPPPTSRLPESPAPPQAEAASAKDGRIGALLSRMRDGLSRKPPARDTGETRPKRSAAGAADIGISAQDRAPTARGEPSPAFASQEVTSRSSSPQGADTPDPRHVAQPMDVPRGQPSRTQPQAGYPDSRPVPTAEGQTPSPLGPAPYPRQTPQPLAQSEEPSQATDPAGSQPSIDEIRASLREFREAVHGLTGSRAGRRYF
ncbi:GumC family protein [Mesorhizobium sp. ES1-1]|uniref:GumC family protein n=1 Tax=Mesorhizobium sp. ES1-1 TaxID=2876629 RepID=UPI001CCF6C34|nr:GumC family protein [Mesorhizobium sp. ES1-1]MBZ9674484.1 succinoglycan biosynthesis protein exop [Mesorhizobium sp. ES1-1]